MEAVVKVLQPSAYSVDTKPTRKVLKRCAPAAVQVSLVLEARSSEASGFKAKPMMSGSDEALT